jgi:hypothetical protein
VWKGDEYRAVRIFVNLKTDEITLEGNVKGDVLWEEQAPADKTTEPTKEPVAQPGEKTAGPPKEPAPTPAPRQTPDPGGKDD